MKLEHGNFSAGAKAAEFPLVKENLFARGLFNQYFPAGVPMTREEFVTKLDKGIKELQAKVNKF